MLIAGASRHAKDLLLLFRNTSEIVFFDDLNQNEHFKFLRKFEIIRTLDEAKDYFTQIDNRFVLGLGNPQSRIVIAKKLQSIGGELTSVVADSAIIGSYEVIIEKGVNLMHQVFISNCCRLGKAR